MVPCSVSTLYLHVLVSRGVLSTQTCSYITHIDTYTHISCQIIDQLASFIKHLVILSYKVFACVCYTHFR